ncbi:MAG: transketolase [Acidimicrobiaceae bacterium]|nr:transketolase [Acidimicrobiaceae bacterium]MCY4279798.1 transketolase [Acidimicrobiaceae bacterium]MCY4295087.1 transketolase [Acidimicrobiaceae bacterium]
MDERLGINVIKALAMDAPHAARSGHQGTAMALAPLAHVLWTRIMRYDAERPDWPDRDRFVLSAGHASILQYAMLYLTGHGLTLEDLKNFRQWGSPTPGHPEAGCTPGVEVTTGPLGQGIANAVGMAVAETQLRSRFGAGICDHRTFVIAGDGDLCEGVSHEAASLAGHLKLGRLVVVYDDNRITIDGPASLALSDDAAQRFAAYGWHVAELGDAAEDLDALESALHEAVAADDRPSLLILRSVIAGDAPRSAGTSAAHGYAIFDEEIAAAKKLLGLPEDEAFHVPAEVLDYYRRAGVAGQSGRTDWESRAAAYTGDRAALEACLSAAGLPGWEAELPSWAPGEALATRQASNAALRALAPVVPGLTGGGADLTGNTGTAIEDHGVFSDARPDGRQIYFGVREHAMGAVANGMALHGGAIPVVGTFLVFADYMRPAVRLAALSGAKVIFVWSHDSVGVGEDGPTHQPVEHLASLRAIPGLRVIRPADANETVGAWRVALQSPGPTALILTRQSVPVLDGARADSVAGGGYALREPENPLLTLVSTGSEVSLCCEAAEILAGEGVAARVVSLPSWDLFAARPRSEQDLILRPDLPSLAVEAGVTLGWHRWCGEVLGIDRFGASAPGATVMRELGISTTNIVDRARRLLT